MHQDITNRLNIFVDETGEFGFSKGSSKLYGVSLVFHEQKDDLAKHILQLNQNLAARDFYHMVHMGDLVMGHGDFEHMSITERRKIYLNLYRFAKLVPARYHTIIIDKRTAKSASALARAIQYQLNAVILDHLEYFQKFHEVIVYYDNGQSKLTQALNQSFGQIYGYHQQSEFDHAKKKLFQVADMLTYVDKLIYKYNHGIKFTKTEYTFFNDKEIKNIMRNLKSHRFASK